MAGATEDCAVGRGTAGAPPPTPPPASGPGPSALGPALTADGAVAEWVRHAMDRAAESDIDPRRVALALGIPLRALDRDV